MNNNENKTENKEKVWLKVLLWCVAVAVLSVCGCFVRAKFVDLLCAYVPYSRDCFYYKIGKEFNEGK